MAGKSTLHFPCGKLASGKTTLARRIGLSESAILFCEDEWLTRLFPDAIETFRDYPTYSARFRQIVGPHAIALLQRGVSVVFDFAGNAPRERAWVRSLFETAGAAHALHYVIASDALCKVRLRQRNATRPEGLFWTATTEEEFDAITKHFVPPGAAEGFTVVEYPAD